MNLTTYQEQSRKTAMYLERGLMISYPTLGLVGEFGEVLVAIHETDLMKECGDVCWYCANLATDLGIVLDESKVLASTGTVSIKNVCRVAELVKKILRDGSSHKDYQSKVEEVSSLIHTILAGINNLLKMHGLSFENCLQTNLDKLFSRKERGVLGGSGDQR